MRLIDADKLIEKGYSLERIYPKDKSTMVLEKCKIEDIPVVDVIPVIRCHDCEYSKETNCVVQNILECNRLKMITREDWFCAEGRRKNETN